MRLFLFLFALAGLAPAQTLSIYSGNGQIVEQLFQSTAPLVVQATDASGKPLAGVNVAWSVTPNGGTLISTTSVTDANGLASTGFVGTTNGVIGYSFLQPTVTAKTATSTVNFVITISISNQPNGGLSAPPLVSLLSPAPGSTLTGAAGSTLVGAVKIQVTAQSGFQAGQPVPNVGVRVPPPADPTQPSASCNGPAGTVLTGANGIAICDLVLGTQTGTGALSVLVGEIQNTPYFNLTVTPGVACLYSLTPVSQTFGATGGTASVALSTTPGCGWSATASDSWISITSPATGAGSATLSYSVTANGGSARGGSLTIGGQKLTISEAGASGPAPLSIITTNLPAAVNASFYSTTLTATGGTPPYLWAVTAGSLPSGLSLNSMTGLISGTPSAAVNFNFTVSATDAAHATVSQAESITVAPSGTGLVITNTGFQPGTVGQPYVQALTSTQGCSTPFSQMPSFHLSSGSLPTGLSLQPTGNSYVIAGTPTIAGSYSFGLTVQDACGANSTANFTITITSTNTPVLTAAPAALAFTVAFSSTSSPASQVVSLTAGSAVAYNASATTATGGNWLSLTNSSGTTPGSLSVNIGDTSKLAPGTYTGTVTITSPSIATPVLIPVSLTVIVPPTITVSPLSISVTLPNSGSVTSAQQAIVFSSGNVSVNFTATAATNSGGPWLFVNPTTSSSPANLLATINAAGLPAGVYNGSITIATVYGNQIVSVSLTVTAPFSVAPLSLTFAGTAGSQPVTHTFDVNSTTGSASFTVNSSTASGGSWLTSNPTSGTTPATITVTANPDGLAAGSYTGVVSVQSSDASVPIVHVAVTFTVLVGSNMPMVNAVTNAASFAPGPVAPGELITIFGTRMGPANSAIATLNAAGLIDTMLAGTRVLFDGNAAPLIYTSAGQVSAIVPYSVYSLASSMLQVEYQGVLSNPINLRVADASPAVFVIDNAHHGAILNQDTSINASNNAAQQGSIVSIFATGAGQTSPGGVDGQITNSPPLPMPLLPVRVLIGGQEAEVVYAGAAPGLAAGVLQVNAKIPTGSLTGGQSVPVVLIVGTFTSPEVQMWIQ